MRKSTIFIGICGFICIVWVTAEVWQMSTPNPAPLMPNDSDPTIITQSNPDPIPTKPILIPKNIREADTPPTTNTTSSPPANLQIFATLTIDQKQFPIHTNTNTLFQILQNISQRNEIQIKTRTFPGMGEFVEEINGIANDKIAGKYWIYYINGTAASVGISQYTPKQNDIIEWKYEIQKF